LQGFVERREDPGAAQATSRLKAQLAERGRAVGGAVAIDAVEGIGVLG